MWKRFRRRSMTPRRPAVFPEQWGLAMVSVGAVVLGVAAVLVLYAVS